MAIFTGTTGNDTITTASGGSLGTFTGGTVAELIDGTGDTFNAGDGADSVQASSGADTINGDAGNDTLFGGGGADSILGGTGNDFLGGNNGSDFIDGGDGNDKISFNSTTGTQGVRINMSAGTFTVGGISLGTLTARDEYNLTDTFTNVEEVRGAGFSDFFLGSAGYNWFEGRGEADTYEGGNSVKYVNNSLLAFQESWNWVDYRQDGGTASINITLANAQLASAGSN